MVKRLEHLSFVDAVSVLRLLTNVETEMEEHPFMRLPGSSLRIVINVAHLYEVRISDYNSTHNVHALPYSPYITDYYAQDWEVWA